jgi:hypothetical protein
MLRSSTFVALLTIAIISDRELKIDPSIFDVVTNIFLNLFGLPGARFLQGYVTEY